MGKNCRFSSLWLEKDDGQGFTVKDWAVRFSDHEASCFVCGGSRIVVTNKGFQALIQHAATDKHKKNFSGQQGTTQLMIKCASTMSNDSSSSVMTKFPSTIQIYSPRDQTTRAELIWTLKCVASDFSAASCHDLRNIFQSMFGVNQITENFTLGRTKATYLLNDAVAPFFRSVQHKDMEDSFFTLLYDETTNAAGQKELQTSVRYWSKVKHGIIFQHLETFFIGSATSDIIVEKLNEAMDHANLSTSYLLMLGSDGPNVNKGVFRKMNSQLIEIRKKCLIDLGTCNIHVCHNAFLSGMDRLGEEASSLLYLLHDFFHGWPTRWEDFCSILEKFGVPLLHFIQHASSRWLTIQGAAERSLIVWEPTLEYFLKFLPNKQGQNLHEKECYLRIVKLLKKPTMKAEMMFVVSSSKVLTNVTKMFQKEEPLIHLLHSQLTNVVKILIGRSCKKEDLPYDKVFEISNLLEPKNVVLPQECLDELSAIPELKKTLFFKDAQSHYIAVCKHILNKSSLKSDTILRDLQYLHPDKRVKSASSSAIVAAAQTLPWRVESDVLKDEWKLLQGEKILEIRGERIDEYWARIFDLKNPMGKTKYPTVSKVVKAFLTLSHGNADVERGFSVSGRILTDDRASMSERTLNSILTVKYVLKQYNNLPHTVPLTKELLDSARCARNNYENYLEAQKKKKEEAIASRRKEEQMKKDEEEKLHKISESRKKLHSEEEKLATLRKEEEQKLKNSNKLLEEANVRLKKALEKQNMQEIQLAQAMLVAVRELRKESEEKREEINKTQKTVEKRQNDILDFISKKKRKSK